MLAPVNAVQAILTRSIVAQNSTLGILVDGPVATLRVGNTTITGNAMGINRLNGGQLLTYGDNRVIGNPNTGAANNGVFVGGAQPTQ